MSDPNPATVEAMQRALGWSENHPTDRSQRSMLRTCARMADRLVAAERERYAPLVGATGDPEWEHLAVYIDHINDSPRGGPSLTYWSNMVKRLQAALADLGEGQ